MLTRALLALLLFLISAPFAHAFQIPDTGITECYDANGALISPCPSPGQDFYGQDGNINYNAMSYSDNGDTVIDNVTGLVWQKEDDSQ